MADNISPTANSVHFERLPYGAVRMFTDDGFETVFQYNIWASIIAQMSYYGEEDFGWYRALEFHLKTTMPTNCPLADKPGIHLPGEGSVG